jgi:hypothetical protein
MNFVDALSRSATASIEVYIYIYIFLTPQRYHIINHQERAEKTAGEERETEKNPSVSLNSRRKAKNIPR